MEQSLDLTQNVDTLFSNLEKFTQTEGLIGKAVTFNDKTFLPVVTVTLGYAGGNSAAKKQDGGSQGQTANQAAGMGNMAGGALGLGAKLSTEAVIVIDKDNVSMMQISPAANATQLMDKIPQILTGINQNKQQAQQQAQQNQPQGQQAQQNQAQGQQGQQ